MYLPGHARGYDDFHLGGFHLIALDGNFTLSVESCEDAPWVWYESLIPDEERRWLRDRLAAGREPVVVLCHQNLDDRGGDPHLVRNGGQIRSLLAGSGRVRAVVQGHCHGGAFSRHGGIPCYTLPALCEGTQIPCGEMTLAQDGRVEVRMLALEPVEK